MGSMRVLISASARHVEVNESNSRVSYSNFSVVKQLFAMF